MLLSMKTDDLTIREPLYDAENRLRTQGMQGKSATNGEKLLYKIIRFLPFYARYRKPLTLEKKTL